MHLSAAADSRLFYAVFCSRASATSSGRELASSTHWPLLSSLFLLLPLAAACLALSELPDAGWAAARDALFSFFAFDASPFFP